MDEPAQITKMDLVEIINSLTQWQTQQDQTQLGLIKPLSEKLALAASITPAELSQKTSQDLSGVRARRLFLLAFAARGLRTGEKEKALRHWEDKQVKPRTSRAWFGQII